MRILFDARELYFLTQYVPVYRALLRRRVESSFVAYRNRPTQQAAAERAYERGGLPVVWFDTKQDAVAHYRAVKPDWIVFGNCYGHLAELPTRTRTAQLYHGIGMKSDVYSPGLQFHDVRFVEGPHYSRALRTMFPGANIVEVGYAKIDPLFWPDSEGSRFDLGAAGLDPGKPTLLYAPTHSPSSFPLMPDDWPARFSRFNLIVKPHFLSFFGSKRKSHRRKMALWERAPNAYVAPPEEYDPIPFMASSDLLISDASSVLFEFAATGRPVVWCDFLWIHWTRRGPLRYRLRRRMDSTIDRYRDIGAHAARFRDLEDVVLAELRDPGRHAAQRDRYTRELIGRTDGLVSERIADYLLGSTAETVEQAGSASGCESGRSVRAGSPR